MAHYAFLDENNIVTEVIVGVDETKLIDGLNPETWYGNFRGQVCKRTSYNNNIRKNYAGIGMIFDEQRDAFYFPQPFPSWILNEDSWIWEPPVLNTTEWEFPYWNEATQNWEAPREDWQN